MPQPLLYTRSFPQKRLFPHIRQPERRNEKASAFPVRSQIRFISRKRKRGLKNIVKNSYSDEIVPRDFLRMDRATSDVCIGADDAFTPPALKEIVRKRFEEAGYSTSMMIAGLISGFSISTFSTTMRLTPAMNFAKLEIVTELHS
ncbi:MAG: hypothetical protein IJ231_01875 [Clostridia bacterium]|nr:hypothetical protein [Clostridia bacterium]